MLLYVAVALGFLLNGWYKLTALRISLHCHWQGRVRIQMHGKEGTKTPGAAERFTANPMIMSQTE
jgi:hypothetical protein